MSSFYVAGFLALSAGRRVMTITRSNTRTYHCHYATVIECLNGDLVPAEIRVYSCAGDTPLEDGVVAYVVAKAALPSPSSFSTVVLDAMTFHAFPGDPKSESYEDALPTLLPVIFGIGQVIGKVAIESDGVSHGFNLLLSEFVRDSSRVSTIHCIFDGSGARWRNTPSPDPNALIHVYGSFASIHDTLPTVILSNFILNLGSNGVTQPNTPAPSPVKKRKFAMAAASPSFQSASTSASHSANNFLGSSMVPTEEALLNGSNVLPSTVPTDDVILHESSATLSDGALLNGSAHLSVVEQTEDLPSLVKEKRVLKGKGKARADA